MLLKNQPMTAPGSGRGFILCPAYPSEAATEKT